MRTLSLIESLKMNGEYGMVEDINKLIAAERERCAKIAEGMNYGGGTEYDAGRRLACLDIATAIRTGDHG